MYIKSKNQNNSEKEILVHVLGSKAYIGSQDQGDNQLESSGSDKLIEVNVHSIEDNT